MKTRLLLVLLFVSPSLSALAGNIWLHPPTKGIADPGPAKAWLEGRFWKVNDQRKEKEVPKVDIPLTPAHKLGLGVWYHSLVDSSAGITLRKPAPKPVDLDAISLLKPEKKDARSSSLTEDSEFELLKAKLDALEAELEIMEAAAGG